MKSRRAKFPEGTIEGFCARYDYHVVPESREYPGKHFGGVFYYQGVWEVSIEWFWMNKFPGLLNRRSVFLSFERAGASIIADARLINLDLDVSV